MYQPIRSGEAPPVDNDPAIAALAIVESAGESRTWWLRKMQAEVQKSVDDGRQVEDIEIHRMMSQYRDDVTQWGLEGQEA